MRDKLNQQKRQHRERGQLANRSRLGLLEKHKDYVKRARDFHSKEDRLKKLRERASARNKDEFYFGMVNSRTERGVHIQDRGNEPMPVDIVKLLKTQDAGYVRTLISTEEKLIGRLRNSLGSTVGLLEDEKGVNNDDSSDYESDVAEDRGEGTSKAAILDLLNAQVGKKGTAFAPSQAKKTYFVDSAEAVERFKPKALKPLAQPQPAARKTKGKGKAKAVAASDEDEDDASSGEEGEHSEKAAKEARRAHLSSQTTELSARLERLALLQRTYREMQVQRALMGKGSKSVVGDRKGKLSREDERLNEDMDELELKRLGSAKKKLPEPEKGVRTGARVWKWRAERRR